MNARQMKKCLKKQINKLQLDNDLMRRIISDSPKMQELYDLFNKPTNVHCTTIPFQEFKAKRTVPVYMSDIDRVIEQTKLEVARDLFGSIKDNITYEVDEQKLTTVIGSIFIGRK